MNWLRAHRWHLGGGFVAIILIAAAYLVGKGSVDTHSTEIGDLQAELHEAQSEVKAEKGQLSLAEGEVSVANERTAEVEGELASERSFKGEGEKQDAAEEEYETDFPWGAAGRAGNYIFKPIAWEQDGEKWLLTVEAKNVSHEPLSPFCGGAESVVIDAGQNNYTGESVLGSGAANCDGELEPGSTATYKAEFKIATNAAPVVIAIYGEYSQEEESKTWELPH
jgi:hypothetical protein